MKKFHLLLLSVTLCLFAACHDDIWDAIDGLDSRVTKLEELCKEMNTNITSLQTIVDVLQSNDFITSIVEIKKDGKVVGYTITFGKHDPITIYHGQDGKDGQNGTNGKDGQDGQNGTDGKDGITPVIGVAQDTDGVYYWTLNGEWLLDDNGNKLPVSGKDGQNGTNGSNGQDGADGKDGQDGEDGKDGVDGQDGKDGITPQLKIEDGYWFISYDNGATWTQLGKAAGEDGDKGDKGDTGDSMFQSVTQDENYVYFTLADGIVIKIAKGNGNSQSNDDFIFTITYDPNGGAGVMLVDTFYYGYVGSISSCTFTKEGYYFIEWNTRPNGSGVSYNQDYKLTIDKNITLYAQWSTNAWQKIDLGLSIKWSSINIGALSPEDYGEYFAWGETTTKDNYNWRNYKWCNGSETTLTKYNSDSDYGTIDNKTTLEMIDDAAHVIWGGNWRIPTIDEWEELHNECIWEWTRENNINGYKVISKTTGCSIFLPAAGYRYDNSLSNPSLHGYYWASTLAYSPRYGHSTMFSAQEIKYGGNWYYDYRAYGHSIRPVCP